MIDMPRFSADETQLVGFASSWLGGWWTHPDDDIDLPARGGRIEFGFLFVHRLPSQRVTHHKLHFDLPAGWVPTDPESDIWYAVRDIVPEAAGIRAVLPGGVPFEFVGRQLAAEIVLPAPHPSGGRFLQ
jgi:hypothetical protein